MERETTTQEELRRAHDSLETLQNRLEDENRPPRGDEKATQDRLERKIARLHLKADLEAQEEAERRKRIQESRMMTLGSSSTNWGTFGSPDSTSRGSVRVSSEPLTYESEAPHSFFKDMFLATRLGDQAAQARLQRHREEMRVERRDLSSTDGVGGDFIPPLHLADLWTTVARASRPTANVVRNLPLPSGTDTLSIPKVLTGSATSGHADLGTVQETNPTTGKLDVPVKTIAGQVDVSRQALDRSAPGLDEVLFQDLIADYNMRLDLQILTGSGSGANAKGILSDANRLVETWTQGHADCCLVQ
jgi:HK97 family phage major capsid protein